MSAMDADQPRPRGSRVLRSPPIRILLAALFLVLPFIVLQLAAAALSIDWSVLGPALVVIALVAYRAYVRAIEKRRPIHEIQTQGMPAQLAAGFVIGAALFGATMLVLWLLGVAAIEPGQGWGALLLAFMRRARGGVLRRSSCSARSSFASCPGGSAISRRWRSRPRCSACSTPATRAPRWSARSPSLSRPACCLLPPTW